MPKVRFLDQNLEVDVPVGTSLLEAARLIDAPEGSAALNPAFDVTPAALITALITERGAVRAPYGDAIDALTHEPAVAR